DREKLLGFGIAILPDPQRQRTTIDVGRHVHLTLVLGQRQPRRIPAERPLACAVGDRQPEEIGELGAGNAFGKVLVVRRAPASGQIRLGTGGRRREHNREQQRDRRRESSHRGLQRCVTGGGCYTSDPRGAAIYCSTAGGGAEILFQRGGTSVYCTHGE